MAATSEPTPITTPAAIRQPACARRLPAFRRARTVAAKLQGGAGVGLQVDGPLGARGGRLERARL